MAVSVLELGRMELDSVVFYHLESLLCHIAHAHEPLGRELGFDDSIGALGMAHIIGVVLNLLNQTGLLKVFDNLLAAGKTVHAGVLQAMFVEGTIIIEDVDGLEAVFQSKVVVVDVVCRSDFQCTGTELTVDILVHDNLHRTTHSGDDHTLALQSSVARVFGMHTDSGIAKDGLGTRCSHHNVLTFLILLDAGLFRQVGQVRPVRQVISQVIQFTVALLVDNLLVADGCEGLGIPVHHTHAAIDKSLVVEVDENTDDALIADIVHGEGGAVPVARGTQLTQLLKNDAAILFLPLPCVLQELVAGQTALVDAAFLEHGDHFGLGRDAGMVGAWYPAGIQAQHTGAAYQHILNGVVEHVTHVQHTRHVGRGYHNSISLTIIGF